MTATRAEVKREALLDAAVRALRSRGADVSMNEIAGEAGVTKPVLYQHFDSKAGLAEALGDRYLADLGVTLNDLLLESADAATAVTAGVRVFVSFAATEPELFRFLMEGAGPAIDDSPMAESMIDLMVRFLTGPLVGLPDARRARIWGVALMSTVISTVPWALAHERDATRASLVEDLSALLLRGIGGS